jgi:nucleoporin NUP2
MTISTSFKPSSNGNSVSFLGFDLNGKPGPYQLRVKTATDASNILKALEEEVEALKGEST